MQSAALDAQAPAAAAIAAADPVACPVEDPEGVFAEGRHLDDLVEDRAGISVGTAACYRCATFCVAAGRTVICLPAASSRVRVQDAGCRVHGAGCRVQGAGCRVRVKGEKQG